MDGPVSRLGDAVVGQDVFGGQLVHGQGRTEHAGPHVGHVRQLKEALKRAVLAEWSVDEGKDNQGPGLGVGSCLGYEFGEAGEWIPGRARRIEAVGEVAGCQGVGRRVGVRPAALPVDPDGDEFVAVGVRCGQHVAGRDARDVVLGTPTPEQDDETTAARHLSIVGSRSVRYRAP